MCGVRFLTSSTHSGTSIGNTVARSLHYDTFKDFVPVGTATGIVYGLAVGASVPAKNLKEFLALAKLNPRFAAYGSPGAGTPMHFLGAMLARDSKVPLSHIPYRGESAALTDAIGGTLPAVVTTLPNLLPMHRAGKLRILAVSSAEPVPSLPGVPTFASQGFPDLVMSEVFGFFARKGTPAAAVAQLNAAISAADASPGVVEAMQKLEFTPQAMSSDALGKYLASDHARWASIVKATGYTPED